MELAARAVLPLGLVSGHVLRATVPRCARMVSAAATLRPGQCLGDFPFLDGAAAGARTGLVAVASAIVETRPILIASR